MILNSTNNSLKERGFTIVELLVVIVVIGILAAITIVSYTGITNKANTAAAQAEARAAIGKINAYYTDQPYGMPTSYGNLTGAPANSVYYANGLNFTIASGNRTMTNFRPAGIANDAIDFSLCGTNTTAAATSYATVNVPTGIIIGYWDNSGSGSLNVSNVVGSTSGNHTNGYAITCYKVGIAEAVIAVAKAIYTETGTYPATAAAIAANTASSAKLPPGLTIVGTATNPTTGNGTTTLRFECGSAVAATAPCNNTGGRISFWDYSLGTPAVATITYGTATNFYTPGS